MRSKCLLPFLSYKDDTQSKTRQAKNQEVSSFPADDYKTILNNKYQRRIESRQTSTIIVNSKEALPQNEWNQPKDFHLEACCIAITCKSSAF